MIIRKIFPMLIKHLERDEFSVLIGARQTGKTTILKQLEQYLEEKNQKCFYVSLEDFDILKELNNHPENLFKFINKNSEQKTYILIDEIQYLNNPSNFLKLLFDKYATIIKIICTGSSAFYIDEKFKDSLAGRKKIFELRTLDFEEFLSMKGLKELIPEKQKIALTNDYISLKRNELNVLLDEYMTYGAYPAVVKTNDTSVKLDILKDLFQSYLKKDIYEAGVKQHEKFYQLMTILTHQTGSLINLNELSNTLGISTTAANNYINILQKTFHIQLVRPFFGNIRKELTKMPKIYILDLGLRNIILNMFMPVQSRIDKGIILENQVFNALNHRYNTDNIKFWRTADGNEIDFVIDDLSNPHSIEVKFSQKEFNPLKYSKFTKQYPHFPLKCISYNSVTNLNHVFSLL